MDKLIITCCTNDSRRHRSMEADAHMPMTAREIADAVRTVRDAGAAVVHVHQPFTGGKKGRYGTDIEAWLEVRRLIEQESDVIFEHGQGGTPYFSWEDRILGITPEERPQTWDSKALRAEAPEMIALRVAAGDHDWGELGISYKTRTREDLAKALQLCRESNVKPELEIWHVGSYYNLQWLIERRLLDPPYWLTPFFAGRGGVWSPPTVEELQHRLKNAPEPNLWQVAVWGGFKGTASTQQQLALFAAAIAMGGHIRVGMEDNPFLWDGVPAKSNAELVERVVRIARDLGREIATPDEARQMIGLPPRNRR